MPAYASYDKGYYAGLYATGVDAVVTTRLVPAAMDPLTCVANDGLRSAAAVIFQPS